MQFPQNFYSLPFVNVKKLDTCNGLRPNAWSLFLQCSMFSSFHLVSSTLQAASQILCHKVTCFSSTCSCTLQGFMWDAATLQYLVIPSFFVLIFSVLTYLIRMICSGTHDSPLNIIQGSYYFSIQYTIGIADARHHRQYIPTDTGLEMAIVLLHLLSAPH